MWPPDPSKPYPSLMTLSPPLSSWLTPFWTYGFLAVPLTNHGLFYLWAFACAVPSLWNPHGPRIPMNPSLSPFRSHLRCHPSGQPSLSVCPHQLKHPPPPNLSLCTLILLYFPFTRGGGEGTGEGRERNSQKEECLGGQPHSGLSRSLLCSRPPTRAKAQKREQAKGRRVLAKGEKGEDIRAGRAAQAAGIQGEASSREEEDALRASSQAPGVTPAVPLPDCVTSGRHASLWPRESTAAIIAGVWSLSRVRVTCDPVNGNPPASSVHEISQARTLEWLAISFSGGSSRPRDRTHISCTADGFSTAEPPGKLYTAATGDHQSGPVI